MTSERRHRFLSTLPLAAGLVVLAVGGAGCGNYSNEDLEFMNALPERGELEAAIPERSALVAPADEAELARMTHNVTRDFNTMVAKLVAMVDFIRSFPPTSRTPDSRTWGPFEADRNQLENRDFQTRMIMSRDLVVLDQFNYEISVHKLGNSDLDWPVFIRGSFRASRMARRGVGHVEIVTADVRAEGFVVEGMLDTIVIDYDTVTDPISVNMTITSLRDPLFSDEQPRIVYAYRSTLAGQGEMTFDLFANLVPGLATEHTNVTTQWLPTGDGRGQLTVVTGDGAGSQQTECWGSTFVATYNDKPWATNENVPGDPAVVCPNIPRL